MGKGNDRVLRATFAASALRQHLLMRSDGYWELFATALGNVESIAKTVRGLTAESLAEASKGAAVSPSLVEQRVQALAAYDGALVRELTRAWKPMREIRADLFDEGVDFWTVAWSSSLRFLMEAPVGAEAEELPLELRREVDVVFGGSRLVSVDEGIELARDPSVPYRDLRRVALRHDGEVSEPMLVRLLESNTPTGSQLERLRIFQGSPDILSVAAVAFLEDLLLRTWPRGMELPLVGGFPILIEIIVGRGTESAIVEVVDRLSAGIDASLRPADWAPFAYLLLGTGWTCP